MNRSKLLGATVGLLAAAAFVGPAHAFIGKSVAAADCSYGGKVKSIEATDELTVTFTMCKPDPAFMAKAAFTPFGIQPEEHLAATGGGGDILEKPIGTGPWKLQKWARGDSNILKRFADYWGDKANYETLVIRWSDSGAGRLIELRAGTVDQITNIGPDDFDSVKNDSSLIFIPVANPNTLYLAMTNTFAPFDKLEVRTDPEAMVVLKYADTGPQEASEVKLSRDQVTTALIRYCSNIKVPLPRSAQKVLQPAYDGISLLINIDWGKGTPKK